NNFDPARSTFVVSGRKVRQFILRTKRELQADFELKDAPSFVETKPIARFCLEQFLSKEVDEVTVVYTKFINTINHQPTVSTLLPISNLDLPKANEAAPEEHDPMVGYMFEPSPEAV